MKNQILKFIPGVALSIAVVAIGAFAARAQSTSPAVPVQPPQVQAPSPVIVCGVCGAQIGQPQAVLVSPGVYQGQQGSCRPPGYPVQLVQGYDGSYYFVNSDRIPPAPVFSLTDYWRADPRLIVRDRRFVHGSVPVRRFHH